MKINERFFGELTKEQEIILVILESWGLTFALTNDDLIRMINQIIEALKKDDKDSMNRLIETMIV